MRAWGTTVLGGWNSRSIMSGNRTGPGEDAGPGPALTLTLMLMLTLGKSFPPRLEGPSTRSRGWAGNSLKVPHCSDTLGSVRWPSFLDLHSITGSTKHVLLRHFEFYTLLYFASLVSFFFNCLCKEEFWETLTLSLLNVTWPWSWLWLGIRQRRGQARSWVDDNLERGREQGAPRSKCTGGWGSPVEACWPWDSVDTDGCSRTSAAARPPSAHLGAEMLWVIRL